MPKFISDEQMSALEEKPTRSKGFISDDEMSSLDQKHTYPSSVDPNAALAGYGQGALMGFLPEVSAATEPVFTKAADLLTGQDVSSSLPAYEERKGMEAKRLQGLQTESPGSFKTGEMGGLLASTLEGGGLLASGAKAVGKTSGKAALKTVEKISQSGLLKGTKVGAAADIITNAARSSSKLKGLLPEAEKKIIDPFTKIRKRGQ